MKKSGLDLNKILPALLEVIGVLLLLAAPVGASISGNVPSCVSIYGTPNPAIIQTQGTHVSMSAFFQSASSQSPYSSYSNWQGPDSYIYNGVTYYSWGATPPGQPAALFSSTTNAWSNPDGGAVATIEWNTNIYSWTNPNAYPQSSVNYDLSLYLTGGCTTQNTNSQGQTTCVYSCSIGSSTSQTQVSSTTVTTGRSTTVQPPGSVSQKESSFPWDIVVAVSFMALGAASYVLLTNGRRPSA